MRRATRHNNQCRHRYRVTLVACLRPDSGAEVCDESHYLKGWGTQRTKQVVPLCQKARRAVLLSGTPSLNQVRAVRQQYRRTWAY